MARSRQSTAAVGIAGCLLISLSLAHPARGQEPAASPALSRECPKEGEGASSETLLPNVVSALANRKTLKILTIGGSAAAGRRSTRGGYTKLIEHFLEQAVKGLDVVMVNRGISGELAANAATRIRNEVAFYKPDLVLWQVGANDALAYVDVSDVRLAVVDTIRWLRDHKVDVILVGLQNVRRMQRNEHYAAVRDELRKIGATERVIVIRRGEALQIIGQVSSTIQASDEFEQNEYGYICLAEYVARAITLNVFGKDVRQP
jgi:acyl-CoA thioesterase-1